MSSSTPLSFWLRPSSYAIPENATILERKQRYVNKGAGIWLVLLGPLFCVLNLFQGIYGLALINGVSTALGAAVLLLNRSGRRLAAAILLTSGSTVVFTTSSLLYQNGMEYTLLLAMIGAVFILSGPLIRVISAASSAIAFLFVRSVQYPQVESPVFSLERFSLNLFIFILCFYWLLEICRAVNIAYYQKAEEKNDELQTANDAKEKLFSVIAHDLRGPVGNLKSSVDLMTSGSLSPEQFHSLLPELEREVTATYHCLDTLLIWSANQLGIIRPTLSRLALRAAAEPCLALFADAFRRKEINIVNQLPAEAGIGFDPDQFAIILRNLLSNALKFTPPGGTITLSATPTPTPIPSPARSTFPDGGWRMTLADTGVGMSPRQLEQILTLSPGNSTPGTSNERGLGLGLQICREFLEANGGTLSVESQQGQGTRFHLDLPAPPPPSPSSPT